MIIKCPKCGNANYRETYSTIAYPSFQNKTNANNITDIVTHYCQCIICGNNFTFSTHYGDLYREE